MFKFQIKIYGKLISYTKSFFKLLSIFNALIFLLSVGRLTFNSFAICVLEIFLSKRDFNRGVLLSSLCDLFLLPNFLPTCFPFNFLVSNASFVLSDIKSLSISAAMPNEKAKTLL